MKKAFRLIYILLVVSVLGSCQADKGIRVTVKKDVVTEIDSRIFGQFLERANKGAEKGIEAALEPGTHQLQEGFFPLIEAMHIPIMRFPGGGDAERTDWTELIDLPGRAERPLFIKDNKIDTVTQKFGYDKALRLAEQIGSEMIIAVNFADAFKKKKSIEEAANHAAGLVAYCNLPVGADLPAGMRDWPSLRAKNGHPEPYHVKYIQIANEPFTFSKAIKRTGPIDEAIKAHYFKCLGVYIDAIKAVDPTVQIIADGNCEGFTLSLADRFGTGIDYVAYHAYSPVGIRKIKRWDKEEVSRDSLTEEELWNAWVSVPEIDENGLSVLNHPVYQNALKPGYPIAITEWNWNGWWSDGVVDAQRKGSLHAKGVGAAGFIHAMVRSADKAKIGIQSLLAGSNWDITGIRVSPTAKEAPFLMPTAQIAGLYAQHHGNKLLEIEVENVPVFEQPYRMSRINPYDSVAYVDALATASEEKLFVHMINRHYREDLPIRIDLSMWNELTDEAVLHTFSGSNTDDPISVSPKRYSLITSENISFQGRKLEVFLPKRSVSILEFSIGS